MTDEEPSVELNSPELHNFDIAAVGGGLHHFPDPAKAIGRLAQRLRSGGVLLIVDFVEEKDHHWEPSDADHTIHKHGFSEDEMMEMMEEHGLKEFGWKEMPERLELRMQGRKPVFRKGFLARAVRV